MKIPCTPCREAAPTLAGEPGLLADPWLYFQPHCFFPCLSGSDGLPHHAPQGATPSPPCLPSYGRPCNSRHLVFESIKPNFGMVLSLHGCQALGWDHANGVDPSGKSSPLFPNPSVLGHKRALKHHRDQAVPERRGRCRSCKVPSAPSPGSVGSLHTEG